MRHLFSLLIVVFETQYRKDIKQLLEVQKTLTAISLSTWSTSTWSNGGTCPFSFNKNYSLLDCKIRFAFHSYMALSFTFFV